MLRLTHVFGGNRNFKNESVEGNEQDDYMSKTLESCALVLNLFYNVTEGFLDVPYRPFVQISRDEFIYRTDIVF